MKEQIVVPMEEIITILADVLRDPDSDKQKVRKAIAVQRIKTIVDSIKPKPEDLEFFRARLDQSITMRELVWLILELKLDTLELLAGKGREIFE